MKQVRFERNCRQHAFMPQSRHAYGGHCAAMTHAPEATRDPKRSRRYAM
jgi:hypothetical protein